MKKTLLVCICAIMCLNLRVTYAQADDRSEFLNTVILIEEWLEDIDRIRGSIRDQDSIDVIDVIRNSIESVAVVFVDTTNPQEDVVDVDKDELRSASPEVVIDNVFTYIETGTRYIEEVRAYYECSVKYFDAYIELMMRIYDESGALLGIQQIEVAQKDEQYMLLLIDYDHVRGMTGRFALLPEGEMGNVVYTKTFGKTLDIVLDVESWQAGKSELGEWSKDLLLPVAVLYQ